MTMSHFNKLFGEKMMMPNVLKLRGPLIINSHQNFHSVLKTMKIYEALSG